MRLETTTVDRLAKRNILWHMDIYYQSIQFSLLVYSLQELMVSPRYSYSILKHNSTVPHENVLVQVSTCHQVSEGKLSQQLDLRTIEKGMFIILSSESVYGVSSTLHSSDGPSNGIMRTTCGHYISQPFFYKGQGNCLQYYGQIQAFLDFPYIFSQMQYFSSLPSLNCCVLLLCATQQLPYVTPRRSYITLVDKIFSTQIRPYLALTCTLFVFILGFMDLLVV